MIRPLEVRRPFLMTLTLGLPGQDVIGPWVESRCQPGLLERRVERLSRPAPIEPVRPATCLANSSLVVIDIL